MSQPNTVAQLIVANRELEAALKEERRCREIDNENWRNVVQGYALMLRERTQDSHALELEVAKLKRELDEARSEKKPQGW